MSESGGGKVMKLTDVMIRILMALPTIVRGIEALHGATKDGATKKELAKTSLLLASGVAESTLPEHKPIVEAASNLTDRAIDMVVDAFNLAGEFKHKEQPALAN
jgi:hypothetical protein